LKPSLKQIFESLPEDKKQSDTLWVKFILRKLSFLITWVLIRLHFSAWHVSVLSIFIPIISLYFWIQLDPVTASVFLMLWLLLDGVDGNIARLEGERETGPFVDASSGYMIIGIYAIGIGIYLDLMNQTYFSLSIPWCTFLGGIASILNLMARLYHQKFINVVHDDNNNGNEIGLLRQIERNIGIGGFLTPITFLGVLTGYLQWVFMFYCIYSLLIFLKTAFTLLGRSKHY